MSVLCDSQIIHLLNNGLVDFTRSETDSETVMSQVNPNTLDLTLGRFIQWPKENVSPITFGNDYPKEEYWKLRDIKETKGILLEPGDLFLGTTREYFRMPCNVCGQVYTKSSLGRVFINHMMAGVIDAGFEGTITLELRNEGKHKIILPYGARVVQLQFMSLDKAPDRDYAHRSSRYMKQIYPEPSRAILPENRR